MIHLSCNRRSNCETGVSGVVGRERVRCFCANMLPPTVVTGVAGRERAAVIAEKGVLISVLFLSCFCEGLVMSSMLLCCSCAKLAEEGLSPPPPDTADGRCWLASPQTPDVIAGKPRAESTLRSLTPAVDVSVGDGWPGRESPTVESHACLLLNCGACSRVRAPLARATSCDGLVSHVMVLGPRDHPLMCPTCAPPPLPERGHPCVASAFPEQPTRSSESPSGPMCVCVCARARACVRACVRAFVCVCERERVCV